MAGFLSLFYIFFSYLAFFVLAAGTFYLFIRVPHAISASVPGGPGRFKLLVNLAGDVLFARGTLKNEGKLLWFFETVFHWAFFLVVLRHMRYFFYPVRGVILGFQDSGIIAGYVLPVPLIMLAAVRLARKTPGRIVYLLFLLASLSGILMTSLARPDLVDIKAFVLGLITLRPVLLERADPVFLFHFSMVLLLLVAVPLAMARRALNTQEDVPFKKPSSIPEIAPQNPGILEKEET